MAREFLEFASELAVEAGSLLADYLGRKLTISKKGSINLVTEADLKSEELLVSKIFEHFPHHLILAEESGARQLGEKASEFRWIIDPLDGTTNFAHRYPFFCVSIALEIGGRLEVGVVYDPTARALFTAARGKGARLNGHPIQVSSEVSLGESLVCTGFAYDRDGILKNLKLFHQFMLKTRAVRRDGSAALDLCYVAAGRFEGFWELSLNPWDVAAGALIVAEAGGTVSRFDGAPARLEIPEIVATNGRIHEQMLSIIQDGLNPGEGELKVEG